MARCEKPQLHASSLGPVGQSLSIPPRIRHRGLPSIWRPAWSWTTPTPSASPTRQPTY